MQCRDVRENLAKGRADIQEAYYMRGRGRIHAGMGAGTGAGGRAMMMTMTWMTGWAGGDS
jgi:hypothetical protein